MPGSGLALLATATVAAALSVDECVEAVFAPFHRGRGARGAGSGLGLTIARAIARAHGGDLTVSSPPSGGCALVLMLPACPPSEQAPGAASGPS